MGRVEVADAPGWLKLGASEGRTVLSPALPLEWHDCGPRTGVQVEEVFPGSSSHSYPSALDHRVLLSRESAFSYHCFTTAPVKNLAKRGRDTRHTKMIISEQFPPLPLLSSPSSEVQGHMPEPGSWGRAGQQAPGPGRQADSTHPNTMADSPCTWLPLHGRLAWAGGVGVGRPVPLSRHPQTPGRSPLPIST